MTAGPGGHGRHGPEEWADLERRAAEGVAMCGATIEDIERELSAAGLPGAATGMTLREAAVRGAIAVAGPPATDEAMRQVARILGLTLAIDAAPACPADWAPPGPRGAAASRA
jgi:hypothetical protein